MLGHEEFREQKLYDHVWNPEDSLDWSMVFSCTAWKQALFTFDADVGDVLIYHACVE